MSDPNNCPDPNVINCRLCGTRITSGDKKTNENGIKTELDHHTRFSQKCTDNIQSKQTFNLNSLKSEIEKQGIKDDFCIPFSAIRPFIYHVLEHMEYSDGQYNHLLILVTRMGNQLKEIMRNYER